MKKTLLQIGTVAALAAFVASPALAQTHATTGMSDAGRRDEVRSSKLVGSTVYNGENQTVGTVDDILITRDTKQPVQAVISVGGFLGIGSKLVTVDYDRLKLEMNNKVVMPNASRDELKSMQSFSYNALDHAGTTNASGGGTSTATTGTGNTATGAGLGTPTTAGSGTTGTTR